MNASFMSLAKLTVAQLKTAIEIRKKIDALQAQLAALPKSTDDIPTAVPGKRPKGGMSKAGRARIAAAQRARWARQKGAKKTAPTVKAGPAGKRKMSATARAHIAAAARARWARHRAAKAAAIKPAKPA
jgi:hypothetical protein